MDMVGTTDWRAMMQHESMSLGIMNDEEHEDPLVAARKSYEAASRSRAKRNSQDKESPASGIGVGYDGFASTQGYGGYRGDGAKAVMGPSADSARSDSSRDSGHDHRSETWMQSNYYPTAK